MNADPPAWVHDGLAVYSLGGGPLGLAEMLASATEALTVAGVAPPVDVVGHSQATLCQLALALAEPEVVRSLVLVGAVDGGWRTTRRDRGMPWCWPLADPRRWRFAVLAAPLAAGRSDLRRLKRLQQLYLDASFGTAAWSRRSRSSRAAGDLRALRPLPVRGGARALRHRRRDLPLLGHPTPGPAGSGTFASTTISRLVGAWP